MSLQDLAPVNSQRAQQTAINAFSRFLVAEGVNMQFIAATLLGDMSGARFVKLMDRFAMYLTSAEGRGGKAASIEKNLLEMAQTLERHCLKRFEGGATKRAPACEKEDLRILMDGLYFDAASSKDYQDAALLALMWYAFGRASDLGFVAKSNLTVSADGVVFVRLLRVKTSEEQAAKLRILDASIRALCNSMIQTIGTRDRVPEALRAIFVSLKDKCKAKSKKKKRGLVELDDIQEWLIPPTNGAVGQMRGTYGMRRLL
ncbi:hypothetical protein PHMEG_0001532 [Phytophthora megakarya]|uniref:Uncharacterized protein n=1 Tax=Phytophthora megakarya TaxID=4795 RepID=A0A225X1J9_9STRA|nr:hypothetical protein PHMEG_0001532 [Phytophthora megakarya]